MLARVRRLLHGIARLARRRQYHWRGVYERFEDVPVRGAGFDSDIWVAMTRRATETAIAAASPAAALPVIPSEHELLAMLAATIAAHENSVRILDFGGGMGTAYVAVSAALRNVSVHYDIVESREVCEAGRALFPPQTGIAFLEELPAAGHVADIVYVSTALQYVSDYRAVLERLLAYRPRYVLLRSLSAGNHPTYATEQVTVPGSSIPYWFINRDELVALCEQSRYRLVFAIANHHEYDQSNFPERYRLGRTCTLLLTS